MSEIMSECGTVTRFAANAVSKHCADRLPPDNVAATNHHEKKGHSENYKQEELGGKRNICEMRNKARYIM